MHDSEIEGDVVIAGGGTTGCIIAARLAQARPDLEIVVVESGKDTKDDQRVTRPLDGMFSVYEGADQIRYHHSKPSAALDGRSAVCPVGNILGGSSSINFMMYNNPAGSDFDDWAQTGWSFQDLQPYIQKSEAWDDSPNKVHGRQGNMPVTTRRQDSPLAEAYFKAWADVKSLPQVDDLVDYKTAHGCGYFPKLINDKNGHRSNTAHAYLHALPPSSPMRILTRKTVIRVLFDQSSPRTAPRATGLEICDAPDNKLDSTISNVQTIRARKMVVICGGAFGSPMILERSGIGESSRLAGLGIPTTVDLPGVGEGYQDHELTICAYRVTDDSDTLDDYPRGVRSVKDEADAVWERTGGGVAGTNGFDFGFKIRPSEDDIKSMGPDFEKHWNMVARDKPDKPLYSGPLVNYFMGPQARPASGRYFSLGAFTNSGRGSVHISSRDPHAPPDFDAGLLSHPADLPPHIWAYKLQREVARRMPNFIGEYAPSHPAFPPSSAAGVVDLPVPAPAGTVQPLSYTKEDDEAVTMWVRKTIGTAYHSMSTCRMKPAADGGVVDNRLRVHGTEGLYIADLSICAENMGCNTTTVALVIGEKASAVLEEELRQNQVDSLRQS